MSDPRADLACRQLVEMVTDYLEGELSADDCARLEQHLVICDPCIHYVEQSRLTVEALKLTPRQPPPAAAREALMQAFRKFKGEDKP
jgi:anti-sigma factor RsiW